MQIFLGMFNSQWKLTAIYFQGNLLPCLATNLQEISNIPMLATASIKFGHQVAAECCQYIMRKTKKRYKFTEILEEWSMLYVINHLEYKR